jgi:hypothetical protein
LEYDARALNFTVSSSSLINFRDKASDLLPVIKLKASAAPDRSLESFEIEKSVKIGGMVELF